MTKFYQFLKGRDFIIKLDKPLTAIFGEHKSIPKMASGRIQRWAFFLSGFNYKIEHIKGDNNVVADSLSRLSNNTNETKMVDDKIINVINWVENFIL